MVNSEQDLRCPVEQGEHLFTLLRLMVATLRSSVAPGSRHLTF